MRTFRRYLLLPSSEWSSHTYREICRYLWLLTYLLSYSMEQSHCFESNRFSASQENPHILWSPEGSLPHSQVPAICPYPDLSSIQSITPHFLKIYLSIIVPSTPGSSKWSLSLRFPHQYPVYISTFPHMRYMPRPSHYSRFYNAKSIGWGAQILFTCD